MDLVSVKKTLFEINWPEVLAGVLIPAVVQIGFYIHHYRDARKAAVSRKLLGTFFLYRYSPMRKDYLREDKISMRVSFFNGMKFTYRQTDNESDNIEGSVTFGEGGNIYLSGKGHGHNENGYFVFKNALGDNSSIKGIFCCVDLNFSPVAMHCLMSRAQRNASEIYEVLGEYKIMRIHSAQP